MVSPHEQRFEKMPLHQFRGAAGIGCDLSDGPSGVPISRTTAQPALLPRRIQSKFIRLLWKMHSSTELFVKMRS
jgi:hypothetical protein